MLPAYATSMMEKALEHLAQGQWTEARRSFEAELVAHPKNLEARYNLALLLSRAGHADQELALYQKNMSIGWHLPTTINLVSIHIQNGDIAKARALLKRAIKRFKNDAAPKYMLAEMEATAGHDKLADKLFGKALHADPLNGYAHIRYARFLARQQKMEQALKHAKRAIQLQPECPSCLTIVGNIHAQNHSYYLAVEYYQKSLALQPDPDTRQYLIDSLHKLGMHERAERMQKALDAWLRHQQS